MNYSVILDIIEKIENELSKNDNNLAVKINCRIETKHHLYSGTYSSCKNGVIVLTNSYLCDSNENPIELTETHIQLNKEDIVAFSYNTIVQNIL